MELSAAELFALCGAAGGSLLVGIDDPFFGALPDEVARDSARAQQALRARGLLIDAPDGTTVVASHYAGVAATLAHPDAILVLEQTAGPAALPRRIAYRLNDRSVYLEGVGNGRYDVQPTPGAGLALRFVESLACDGRAATGDTPLLIPASAWNPSASRAASEGDAVPISFRAALAASTHRGSVIALKPLATGWEMAGFAFLDSPNGLWTVRNTEDPALMEASPSTGAALRRECRALIEDWLSPATATRA